LPKVEALVAAVEAEVSAAVVSTPIAAMPEIRCWREAYKAFGVKKTNCRSSVERLLKNVERRAGLPRVNTLVDLYNAASARYLMPVGADDLDRVHRPSASATPGRATASSPSVIRIGRRTRPSRARWSTPMPRNAFAAAGTGIRTRAAPWSLRPRAPC
jgi:hypothetical protein